jgi:hypothetical protein
MIRKKGIYDLIFFKTKASPQTIVSGLNWKQIQDNLGASYKEYINVKDEEHTTEPFIKIVSSETALGTNKDIEEFYYTKRK